jgi:hypothetical protein
LDSLQEERGFRFRLRSWRVDASTTSVVGSGGTLDMDALQ